MDALPSTHPNEQLRQERIGHNWRQQDLADQIGTTVLSIKRWERGTHQPSMYFREKLCALFGKSAEELGLLSQSACVINEVVLEEQEEALVWNVPFPRNPFFTGREELLQSLHEQINKKHTMALIQSWAISGLGGIGKTQVALEYAYQHRSDYSAVFWISSATRETLLSGFVTIANCLQLPERKIQDQKEVIAAVKHWLATHQYWLLILDNADDPTIVSDFLPTEQPGHLLLTTRAQALGSLAQRIEVETMGMSEGTLFLLRRAKLLAPEALLDEATQEQLAAAEAIAIEMDFLPLALDQAGAYIEEVGCHLWAYLNLYRTHRKKLLQRRGHTTTSYPESVATTWSLSFEKVAQNNPAAAELLRLCAFLEPDAIPEELISKGSAQLGPILSLVARDAFQLDEAIQELRKFSLIQRNPEARLLRLHRLVQVILQQDMEEQEQVQWAERVVRATNVVFPETVEMTTWSLCQRYLSQAQICTMFIESYAFAFVEATALLCRTASYLEDSALYEQAEALFLQAVHIQERILGLDHLDVAASLNELAVFYRLQGKYEQAEPLFLRALSIREQALGLDHPDVAYTLARLAILYRLQGKYEQAESLFLRAVHIQEQALSLDHPDMAASLNGLALLHWKRGKYEQAEPLFLRAKHIWEQASGPGHIRVAGVMQNLALLYCEQGKYEQSKLLYEQALPIWEQALGPDHPDVGRVLNSFGELYGKEGKYEQAVPLFLRALSIWEQALGPNCLDVTYSLNGLAEIYREQGRYPEAESLFQRSLSIQEHELEPHHPDIADTVHGLAALQEAQGKSKEAASFYSRALMICEHVYGQEHPKTIDTCERLQKVSMVLGCS